MYYLTPSSVIRSASIDYYWRLEPLGKKVLGADSQKVSGYHCTVNSKYKGKKVHLQCGELIDPNVTIGSNPASSV